MIPAPAGACRTAVRTTSPEPLVNAAILITVTPSASFRTATESVDRRARRRVSVHARVPRSRPSRTAVPAAASVASPRSDDTTSVTGCPSTFSPSMLRSRSPSGKEPVAAPATSTLAKTNVRTAPRRMRRGWQNRSRPDMPVSLGQQEGPYGRLTVRPSWHASHLQVLAQREERGQRGHQQTCGEDERQLGQYGVPADEVDQIQLLGQGQTVVDDEVPGDHQES